MPYWHYQLVLSLYIHQPESHQLSLQNLPHSVRETQPWSKMGNKGHQNSQNAYDEASVARPKKRPPPSQPGRKLSVLTPSLSIKAKIVK